jgi:drug/metabolite transporter (DMT)-like permease
MSKIFVFGLVVGLSLVGVVADALLKVAGHERQIPGGGFFFAGAALYLGTAVGWFFALRHMKLAGLGALYSVATMLLLTGIAVVGFRERLDARELGGVALGVVSVLLLARLS